MTDDLDALARQYWGAWAEAMRNVAPGAATNAHAQSWQPPLDWWTSLAKGGRHGSNDTLDRFNAQSQPWLGMMQQVASQFAGRDAGAADIASAWRQAMGGMGGFNPLHGMGGQPFAGGAGGFAGMPGAGLFGAGMGANPFASLMQGMQQGPGMHGFDQWFAQLSPWLQAMQGGGAAMPQLPGMPQLPTFGFTRERDERWQQLAHAVADLQPRMQAYAALMGQATQDAFAIFERKLAEHEEPGRQLSSARALFDLWIDSAEEAYAPIAMSPEFRTVYGQLVDAQMRVRAGVQREVEHACEQVGMPTRSELDGAHRKIVELERQVRRLRDGAGAARKAGTGKAAATASASGSALGAETAVPKAAAAPRVAAASAEAPASAAQSVARAPAANKPAARKTAAKKSAAKKSVAKKSVAKKQAAKKQAAKTPAVKTAKVRKSAVKTRPAKAPARRNAVVAKPSVTAAAAANKTATDAAAKTPRKDQQRSAARSARNAPAAARPRSARRARQPAAAKTASAPARRATAKAARAPSVSKRGALAVFANAPMPVAPQPVKGKR